MISGYFLSVLVRVLFFVVGVVVSIFGLVIVAVVVELVLLFATVLTLEPDRVLFFLFKPLNRLNSL